MMKCRLFSALLLLFTLMATGCSGQPAAVTAGDLADQVYIYEKEGFGSDFYIALNSDGSMRCSEGSSPQMMKNSSTALPSRTVRWCTNQRIPQALCT